MVIDEHPFSWLKDSRSETNYKKVLIGWKEISREEYNLYNAKDVADNFDPIMTPQQNNLELINQDPSEGLES